MKTPLLLKNVFIKVWLKLRNMNKCPQEQFIVFCVGRSERGTLVYLGLMIIPYGGVKNKQEMVEASNETRLRLSYKVTTVSHWLQVNKVRCRQKMLVSQQKEIAF